MNHKNNSSLTTIASLAFALALLMGLAMAGCGDKDDDESNSSSSSTSTSTSSTGSSSTSSTTTSSSSSSGGCENDADCPDTDYCCYKTDPHTCKTQEDCFHECDGNDDCDPSQICCDILNATECRSPSTCHTDCKSDSDCNTGQVCCVSFPGGAMLCNTEDQCEELMDCDGDGVKECAKGNCCYLAIESYCSSPLFICNVTCKNDEECSPYACCRTGPGKYHCAPPETPGCKEVA